MEPQNNRQSGFTMLEMLVVMFLLAFGVGLMASIFLAFSRTYNRESARVDLYVETSTAMNIIARNIQTAREVIASQTVNGIPHTTDSDDLILSLQSTTNTGILNSGSVDYVAYRLDGPRLMEDIQANDTGRTTSSHAIGRFLQDVTFQYNASTSAAVSAVTVIMRAQRTVNNTPVEVNLQRTIRLRN